MRHSDRVVNEYFEWMYHLAVGKKYYSKTRSYRKLFMRLHQTIFKYHLRMDANRASDGLDLRKRFAYDYGGEDIEEYLSGKCTVFEMILALAIRCEETIMDDPDSGNRTSEWCMTMIKSLGLEDMTDDEFDKWYVDGVIEKFHDRNYKPNGEGGLFTIKNYPHDLRRVDIWYQMLYYLDSIL